MYHRTNYFITAAITMFLVSLMAKLLDGLKKHAPVGFQDESGFHLGVRRN